MLGIRTIALRTGSIGLQRYLTALREMTHSILHHPFLVIRFLRQLSRGLRGFSYARDWTTNSMGQGSLVSATVPTPNPNRLKEFFDRRETGRGIWKWNHYFEIYRRHLNQFVGREVNVLEIGVYSGGSLEMWRDYFGPKCRVYGVDIEKACASYENDFTEIFVGDQADRNFWKRIKEHVPYIDVLIDDGGHQTEQQIVTLEEMLPFIRPGGVYLCEDIHGVFNGFAAYTQGIVNNLNAVGVEKIQSGTTSSEFQAQIDSIHFYPYVTVIEKSVIPTRQFVAPKHGTEWQPFDPRYRVEVAE